MAKEYCVVDERPHLCHYAKNNRKPCCKDCKLFSKCYNMHKKIKTRMKPCLPSHAEGCHFILKSIINR